MKSIYIFFSLQATFKQYLICETQIYQNCHTAKAPSISSIFENQYKILKAVCLTFDLVPKVIQISFQAIDQKLVQCCETKVDADSCKASYVFKTPDTSAESRKYERKKEEEKNLGDSAPIEPAKVINSCLSFLQSIHCTYKKCTIYSCNCFLQSSCSTYLRH